MPRFLSKFANRLLQREAEEQRLRELHGDLVPEQDFPDRLFTVGNRDSGDLFTIDFAQHSHVFIRDKHGNGKFNLVEGVVRQAIAKDWPVDFLTSDENNPFALYLLDHSDKYPLSQIDVTLGVRKVRSMANPRLLNEVISRYRWIEENPGATSDNIYHPLNRPSLVIYDDTLDNAYFSEEIASVVRLGAAVGVHLIYIHRSLVGASEETARYFGVSIQLMLEDSAFIKCLENPAVSLVNLASSCDAEVAGI